MYQELIASINKKFGDNAVMLLSQKSILQVPVLSTGILPLDVVLGVGGVPYGRVVEIYGPEGSGKTTVCLKIIAQAQKLGKKIGFVDAENALDSLWAKTNGVDLDNMMLSQPDCIYEEEYVWTDIGPIRLREILNEKLISISEDNVCIDNYVRLFKKKKKCYKLITNKGSIICSANHRFKTFDKGYVKVKDLQKGDFVESLNSGFLVEHVADKQTEIDIDDAIMLGMLIADGNYNSNYVRYAKKGDKENIKWIRSYLKKKYKGITLCRGKGSRNCKFANISKNRKNQFNIDFKNMLGSFKSRNKIIPKIVFQNVDTMKGMIIGLFSCDSHLEYKNSIVFSTISRDVVEGVKYILSFLGVYYNYYEKPYKEKIVDDSDCLYVISLNSKESINRFNELFGKLKTCKKNKNSMLADVSKKESYIKYPKELWKIIFRIVAKRGLNKSEFANLLCPKAFRSYVHNDRAISLGYLIRINDILKSKTIKRYIEKPVVYSKVMRIEYVGIRNCIDFTTKRQNYICNGFNVHNSGEEGMSIAEMMILGGTEIVVVDSVAALAPRAELAGNIGDSHVGLQARLMSQSLRKLSSVVRRMGAILIFTNQIREKIGITWGNPETTPGGRALRFYASVRLDCRKVGQIKDGDTVIGSQHTIKVVKNKVAPPFRIAECVVRFETGFDEYINLVEAAIDSKIIKKRGSWFSYGTQQIGQGKESVVELLREDQDWFKAINDDVRGKLLPKQVKEEKKSLSKEQIENEQKLNKFRKKLKAAQKSKDKVEIEKYTKLVEKYEHKVN